MILFGVDPSIRETGWAVLEHGESLATQPPFKHSLNVIAHGVWRPKAKDPYDRLVELQDHFSAADEEYRPTDIVIESTSGKIAGRLKGTDANMLLYGVAVGALVTHARGMRKAWIVSDLQYQLHLVTENLWTAGVPKAKRHAATIAEFGLPKKITDHESDAIGLVAWWWNHRHILKETAK